VLTKKSIFAYRTAATLKLPLEAEDDIKRLQACNNEFLMAKNSFNPKLFTIFRKVFGGCPVFLIPHVLPLVFPPLPILTSIFPVTYGAYNLDGLKIQEIMYYSHLHFIHTGKSVHSR